MRTGGVAPGEVTSRCNSRNFTPLYPPLQVRAGVLVVDGFGISLRVHNRGKLRVEDGIGRQRRSLTLDRAGCGLERLVLIGHAGYVTLEALAWLRAIGAALVQIGRDGEVLAHSVPFGYDGHPIRRAQALAVTNGLDLAIARELIAGKLDGQRRILVRLGAELREFDASRTALGSVSSIEKLRVIEANAARAVFQFVSQCNAQVSRARPRDESPARWLRCDSRASVLTGAPRAATSPLNALRNYLFACLESEARLALLAQGLDPALGVLHADQRNRDSLALDAMEPVRADVDAFLLDFLEDREFTARDFGELPNGICRIAAPLTHVLALTLPHWRECLRPIAAHLAQTFRESLLNKHAAPRTLAAKSGNKQRSAPAPERSPLLATPRKASQLRPYATRAWRAPTVEARPANPIACAMCGEPVLKRRRRHCEACMPKARREHGRRAIAAARKALAEAQDCRRQRSSPQRSCEPRARRGDQRGHRRNRSWAREHPGPARRGVVPGARSCRSSMAFRSKRSARRRVFRSRLAHASARGRRCRIRGTGTPFCALVRA